MEKWTNQIDRITKMFIESFSNLNAEQLNWKPDEKTWSIAQNINHLIILNQTYFPKFENIKQGKNKLPFISKFGFIVRFFGNSIKKFAHPDRKKRARTFQFWEPVKTDFSKDILADFQKHQTELKRHIEESKEWINGKTIISSPANNNLVFTLETAFDILVTHEERHYNQAKEVLEALPPSINNVNELN